MGAEVFHALKSGAEEAKATATAVGDEGGFAPNLQVERGSDRSRSSKRSTQAGYKPGEQIALALDPAASEFYDERQVHLQEERTSRKSAERDGRVLDELGATSIPIVSIEDGLAEDDWDGWKTADGRARRQGAARRRRSVRHQHRASRTRASRRASPTRSSIKVNQIGTLTETLDAIEMAQTQRLHLGHLASLGRNRRHLHRRSRGRDRARARSRPARLPHRPHREVQPAAAHRRRAGRRGTVPGH